MTLARRREQRQRNSRERVAVRALALPLLLYSGAFPHPNFPMSLPKEPGYPVKAK